MKDGPFETSVCLVLFANFFWLIYQLIDCGDKFFTTLDLFVRTFINIIHHNKLILSSSSYVEDYLWRCDKSSQCYVDHFGREGLIINMFSFNLHIHKT